MITFIRGNSTYKATKKKLQSDKELKTASAKPVANEAAALADLEDGESGLYEISDDVFLYAKNAAGTGYKVALTEIV